MCLAVLFYLSFRARFVFELATLLRALPVPDAIERSMRLLDVHEISQTEVTAIDENHFLPLLCQR